MATMTKADLETTARALVAEGKGILAADESDGTIKKRFDSIGIESTEENPSDYCIWVNAHALGRYAALSQEAGLVPIVEPEVLMDGAHSIDESYHVTSRTLQAVFTELYDQRVEREGALLKTNMTLSGYEASEPADVDDVAEQTIRCLRNTVPGAIPGIVFLSGGQSDEDATARLNAMNARGAHPWELSFSYGRALQAPAQKAWRGDPANVEAAQQAFYRRARVDDAHPLPPAD